MSACPASTWLEQQPSAAALRVLLEQHDFCVFAEQQSPIAPAARHRQADSIGGVNAIPTAARVAASLVAVC
jgi:hypothetical protein